MTGALEIWDAGHYQLAEGARLVDDRLMFVDILTGRLLRAPLQPGPSEVLLQFDVPLGAVAPIAGRPGEWVAAAGTGIAVLSRDGAVEWIARPEDGGSVATRMNDGVCDPHGRFWAGSMAYDNTPGAGSLYRTDAGGAVERVLDGFTIVNGPAFDSSRSLMYLADTPTGRIFRHTLYPDGSLHDGCVFVQVPPTEGSPDGMTVDDVGRLWVALWGGSRVNCYGADGALVEVVPVPARQPSSVCLADGRLYVTTAAIGLDDAKGADGALLSAKTEASGQLARAWGAGASDSCGVDAS
jgi:sugar lactone lactonase YvrE